MIPCLIANSFPIVEKAVAFAFSATPTALSKRCRFLQEIDAVNSTVLIAARPVPASLPSQSVGGWVRSVSTSATRLHRAAHGN